MIVKLLLALLRGYRACVSPLLPKGLCRFEPSCSVYAADAVRLHGASRGSMLAVRRVLRCRPRGGHGYDPVPLPEDPRSSGAA